MIRTICVLAAAAGLILSYSSCERHSYEVTSKLQHHGDHGDHDDHGDSHGEKHEDGGHGKDKDHKKGDHEGDHAKEKKGEGGRKVF